MDAVKGELHRRLQERLQRAWRDGAFKQESLSAQMEKSQRSISQFLRGDDDAGALDLDEADVALRHIGSSLLEFLSGLPPRELTETERLAIDLDARPHLKAFVADLLPVPKSRLGGVLEWGRGVARLAIELHGARKTGPAPARAQKPASTKSGPRKRL